LANRTLLPASSSYLMDQHWPIFTLSEERPPAKFGATAAVQNSIIANGCRIFGRVENSLLFPASWWGRAAWCAIRSFFRGRRSSRLPHRAQHPRQARHRERRCRSSAPTKPVSANLGRVASNQADVCTDEGLLVIGKGTRIPAGFECTRPAMIDSNLVEDDVRQKVGLVS
jgi:hypothetical protein